MPAASATEYAAFKQNTNTLYTLMDYYVGVHIGLTVEVAVASGVDVGDAVHCKVLHVIAAAVDLDASERAARSGIP